MRKILPIGVVVTVLCGWVGSSCLASINSQEKAASPMATTSGDALLAQVKQAYQHLDQYEAKVQLTINQKQGRWSITRQGEITVAYDRANHRLKIDEPDMQIVVDQGKLRMRSSQLPGQHLEVAAPDPLTYQALIQAVQLAMGHPKLPDVAMLLAANPIEALSDGQANSATTVLSKNGSYGLRFDNTNGTVTLTIDPTTHLISSATTVFNQAALAGHGLDSLTIHCDYQVQKRNTPLPPNTFAFDTTGSTAATSVMQMVQNARAAASAQAGSGAKDLVGQSAPRVKLTTLKGESFDSKDVKAKVLVLDFWATWCGPCVRLGLPLLQNTYEWVHQNHKDVAIYAVNGGETPQTVQQFWSQQTYAMPVLLDTQNQVSQAYRASAIPCTVIIANGKVQTVEVGVGPNAQQTLRDAIDKALQDAQGPAAG